MPRIKEIINASKVISTPVVSAELVDPYDFENAKRVKARIEKTSLGEAHTLLMTLLLGDCFTDIHNDRKVQRICMLFSSACRLQLSQESQPRGSQRHFYCKVF